MKKILLFCFVLIIFKAQSQVTLEFSDKGVLQKFNNSNNILSKKQPPISVNKDFPSILLNKSKVNFDIKLPSKKTVIQAKLVSFKNIITNLNAVKYEDRLIINSVLSNLDISNFLTEMPTFPAESGWVFQKKDNIFFPFLVSYDKFFEILDKDDKQLSSPTNNEIDKVNLFKIKRQLFDNQIVINHLNFLKKEKKSYNKDWEQFKPVLDEIAQKYETWGQEINKGDFFNNGKFNLRTVLYLDSLISYKQSFDLLYNKTIDDNKDWIKGWLWFTEGKIKLNPFDVTDPSPQLQIVDEEISLAEDKIKLLNAYVANRNSYDNYSILEKDLERLESGLSILKHQKEDLINLKTKYEKWINSIKQNEVILYDGILPISSKDTISWIQHYDANNKFEYKNAPKSFPHSIADIDEIVTLVHNVKLGQEISMKSTEKSVPLEPALAIELEPFLSTFAKAFELIPNVGKIANILKPLLSKGNKSSINSDGGGGKMEFSISMDRFSELEGRGGRERVKTSSDDISQISYKEILRIAEKADIRSTDSLLKVKAGVMGDMSYRINNCPEFNRRIDLLTSFNSSRPESSSDSIGKVQRIIVRKITEISNRNEYFFITSEILNCKDEDYYKATIKEYQDSKIKLKWLLEQTSPITEIEPNKEPLTLNSTKILYPEKELTLTSTKLITSKALLVGNDKPIFEKELKKYERQRFWPMAGIAIIPKNREIAIYDNTTRQFKTDTPIGTVEGFVGVKWFVFGKTNIDYKYQSMKLSQLGWGFNRKRGNSLINRCALNIGLGVSHQFMKNYLVGFSIDPVPGIGINIGANYFLQKGYTLENGIVTNEYERFSKPYFYYGVNIDPTIFSKILKLF
jgi:hypothetical protein